MSSSADENPASNLANIGFMQLPPETLSWAQLQQISPAALAYLGDAVYELYIRKSYLMPPRRLQTYHNQVVAQVRAETQARHLRLLEPHLTSTELDILRRGRNAALGRPKRVAPEIYQQATSLEALIGYLYLSDPQRLTQLLAQLELEPT
ncbi:Mini-ribonuclease 3 [Microcoleus sp. FACHB-672]|nr:ribonuclease III domain-containing protein [Microcoleus sp. FACHB-672]MBD2043579.1 Mini-ribonuclease 3 [Microcoleus sp. FACHB-672]